MTVATSSSTAPPSTPRSADGISSVPGVARLDDLGSLDAASLAALYASARTPRVEDMTGDLRGRLLAIVAPVGPLLRPLLRAWAGRESFPWRGKTFASEDPARGTGVNRVVSDGLRLFRFTTSVGPSRAGPFDALQLDYDHAHNPGLIRRVEDEVRELAPGLWLGQAWLRLRGRRRLVLWFGLERA